MASYTQKEKDKLTKTSADVGIGSLSIFGTAWAYLKNVEVSMSLAEQLYSLSIMEILYILTPLLIGAFLIGLVHLRFKIKYLIKSYIDRLQKAEKDLKDLKEKEVERISNNRSRIDRIENNHLIQIELNNKVVDALEEIDDSPKIFLTNEKPDKGIYKFIMDRNQRRIQGPQIALIVSEFRSPKNNSFHKPFSSE